MALMVPLAALLLCTIAGAEAETDAQRLKTLGRERLVLQLGTLGDVTLAFYPAAAPQTVSHLLRLAGLGLMTTNHFFRVDRGFVAQTADVLGGRTAPMTALQHEVAERHVPLEVHSDVKHDKRGILSMARGDDPSSGGSSFSILLGPAPHLDMTYTIFGEVVEGWETLSRLEELPTRREGIFVMPLERIDILSSHIYLVDAAGGSGPTMCTEELGALQRRFDAQSAQLERIRKERLP